MNELEKELIKKNLRGEKLNLQVDKILFEHPDFKPDNLYSQTSMTMEFIKSENGLSIIEHILEDMKKKFSDQIFEIEKPATIGESKCYIFFEDKVQSVSMVLELEIIG
jgi:hypothetical protein